ncbi:MAG: hypothetical protein QOF21_1676 [Actinomycetota bacterium]
MRFLIEQRFAGSLDEVESAFCSPELLARMSTLPKVGGAELLSQRIDGDTVYQQIRYRFTGELSSAVTAVVDAAKLTWVEDSVIDRATHVTTWKIIPDHYASRLTSSGTFRLTGKSDELTVRTTEAELKVHFPLVGGRVERAIVSGLKEHAAGEEEVVAAFLRGE